MYRSSNYLRHFLKRLRENVFKHWKSSRTEIRDYSSWTTWRHRQDPRIKSQKTCRRPHSVATVRGQVTSPFKTRAERRTLSPLPPHLWKNCYVYHYTGLFGFFGRSKLGKDMTEEATSPKIWAFNFPSSGEDDSSDNYKNLTDSSVQGKQSAVHQWRDWPCKPVLSASNGTFHMVYYKGEWVSVWAKRNVVITNSCSNHMASFPNCVDILLTTVLHWERLTLWDRFVSFVVTLSICTTQHSDFCISPFCLTSHFHFKSQKWKCFFF